MVSPSVNPTMPSYKGITSIALSVGLILIQRKSCKIAVKRLNKEDTVDIIDYQHVELDKMFNTGKYRHEGHRF